MNEGVFGQYSVFCVFGSVVGCVVVPLIAQVLQQQSMECMILSAIVLSLTAAHLNKKCNTVNSHSKIVITKDYEKKRVSPNNVNRKSRSNPNHSTHVLHENKHEKEYMQQQQQLEHLKIMEMERRNELKRLKKLQKREERMKRKEEENRRKKELEERFRDVKEKKVKQTKDRHYRHQYSMDQCTNICYGDKPRRKEWNNTSVQNSNKIYETPSKRKTRELCKSIDGAIEQYNPQQRYTPSPLTIKCSSRTASCSSLSSISSCESSISPSSNSKPVWKTTWRNTNSINTWFKGSTNTVETLGCHSDRPVKSYAQSRVGVPNTNVKLVSSSLFSVGKEGKGARPKNIPDENPTTVGEYTLFGPSRKVNGNSLFNGISTF